MWGAVCLVLFAKKLVSILHQSVLINGVVVANIVSQRLKKYWNTDNDICGWWKNSCQILPNQISQMS